jgi:hypothetical protein
MVAFQSSERPSEHFAQSHRDGRRTTQPGETVDDDAIHGLPLVDKPNNVPSVRLSEIDKVPRANIAWHDVIEAESQHGLERGGELKIRRLRVGYRDAHLDAGRGIRRRCSATEDQERRAGQRIRII